MKREKYFGIIAGGFFLAVSCLTGCGKEISVQILDANETTQMTTSAGKSVDDILDDAELRLRKGDKIKPSLDKEIDKDKSVITISRKVKVSVQYEEKPKVEVVQNGGNVQDAIAKAGITLNEKSLVNQELDAYLYDGMQIHIVELSAVKLTVDGKTDRILTSAKTVKEFLNQRDVKLGKKDRISIAVTKPVKDGMKIKIQRVTVKKVSEKESVPYETTTEYSGSIASGKSQVKQSGVNGTKKVIYKVTYVDGKEESRKAVGEKVTQEPRNEIIVQGTKKASSGGGKSGKKVVSREYFDDCDGSGHGVCIITYSDGSTSKKTY